MPTRMIREGILTSERIVKLGWAEEVFYRRLMSVVDDFGRYYATPMLLRAACYPLQLDKVSDSDVVKWTRCAEEAGLVRVYPAQDGKRYLELLDFRQQVRAKASKFPSSDGSLRSTCVADAEHTSSTCNASAHLDVDVDVGVDERSRAQGASADADAPTRSDPIPVQAIVAAYNATMSMLPKVQVLTDKRRTLIRRAWQTDARFRSVGFWQAYFTACSEDNFLNGTGPYTNGHENWRPDLDHLLKPQTVARVFERALDRGERAA